MTGKHASTKCVFQVMETGIPCFSIVVNTVPMCSNAMELLNHCVVCNISITNNSDGINKGNILTDIDNIPLTGSMTKSMFPSQYPYICCLFDNYCL